MPARAIDTATISFGLVSIPVKIFSTNEPSRELHFHLYECPRHGRVERADMVKGFEISRGHYVELSKEELKELEAVASDAIEVRELVPLAAIDPVFIAASYYLAPDRGGDRAYRLMRDALEHADLAAVAAYAARGKQYIVMLRPFEDGLVMHQLRYVDEVKPWSEVGMHALAKPDVGDLLAALEASLAGEAPAKPTRVPHRRTQRGPRARPHAGRRTRSAAPARAHR